MNANVLESLEGFREKWPFAARYARVNGWRMHYVDEGAGDPILLLHGNPTWGFLYRDVIPPLVNAGYRVIVPDMTGFGLSEKPAREQAHSLDGHIANLTGLGFAMSNPERVRALTVMSTWAWPMPPAEFHTRLFPWRTMHAPLIGPYLLGRHNVLARRGVYLSVVGRDKFRREAQAVYEAVLPDAETRLLTWVWPRWIREHSKSWGPAAIGLSSGLTGGWVGLVAKLVWRVKLVAEMRPGAVTETELARIERDEEVGLADLGLQLAEAKQLTAALQAQIVPTQVTVVGERCRSCVSCGRRLTSKGHYPVTFRSLFGDVPVRVRRLLGCLCQGQGEVKSFGTLDFGHDAVAPELAYITARYAALAPFGKVAALLSELLPISGAQNAGTVRNRTWRVGEKVAHQHAVEMAEQAKTQPAGPVVVGLDGGYVRTRHRQEERHFEVIAGKVIDADGGQHRFAFVRNGQAASKDAFTQVLAAAGVHADTPATVLCDGDAGLWRLQRETLPDATLVLDWWHVAVRFEHALQAARGLGAGAADRQLADEAVGAIDRAKWRLWHGRWTGSRRKLAGLYRWTKCRHMREVAGIDRLQHHLSELLGYLERNEDTLVHYAARRRCDEPFSTAFVESAVNEIVAKRMNKKQQMRWNRATVQPFLDVRCAVLNGTLGDAFRHRYPGFRSANDDQMLSETS